MEKPRLARYNDLMDILSEHTARRKPADTNGFLRRHAFALALAAMMLMALPAYLAAMEGQFIDMEFLASLCGISGWGSSPSGQF